MNKEKLRILKKMKRLRAAFSYLKGKYDLISIKRYTTIAGTLVFFLIMSIVPLSFWLTLLIGRLPIDYEAILGLAIFDSVKDILMFVKSEATDATNGASIVLLLTTLYSSTTLFYQMRRSGEIIYDVRVERKGLRLRVGALLLMAIVMATVVVFLFVFALGSVLFSHLFSRAWAQIADYLLLAAVAFCLVMLLNAYVCPHKTPLKTFLPGAILTVLSWIGAAVGFSLYLKISNPAQLYGALSTIIVFLLWLYILMVCFIVGVIINSERVLKRGERSILNV